MSKCWSKTSWWVKSWQRPDEPRAGQRLRAYACRVLLCALLPQPLSSSLSPLTFFDYTNTTASLEPSSSCPLVAQCARSYLGFGGARVGCNERCYQDSRYGWARRHPAFRQVHPEHDARIRSPGLRVECRRGPAVEGVGVGGVRPSCFPESLARRRRLT